MRYPPMTPRTTAILDDARSAGFEVSGDLCEAILVLTIGLIPIDGSEDMEKPSSKTHGPLSSFFFP